MRIISATHRDLEAMVKEGTFREDLYYRLNVATINLPPLRERSGDVPPIANYFLSRYANEFEIDRPTLQPDALTLLQEQAWSGNVRELENTIRKLLVQSQGRPITADAVRRILSDTSKATAKSGSAETTGGDSLHALVKARLEAAGRGELPGALEGLIEELERELYTQAFAQAKGNQSAVSKLVGVSRLTVREKLLKYGLLEK